MVLEICPSADLHLAKAAPFNVVTLEVVSHDQGRSIEFPISDLTFEMTGSERNGNVLSNQDIEIDITTGQHRAQDRAHERLIGDWLKSRAVCDLQPKAAV